MWLMSDPHFFHKNVIGMCNRPFKNVEEMNNALIENINRRVRKKDHLLIAGDFSFAGMEATKDIVSKINGYKIFVKGNHDRKANRLLELGFDDVIENDFIRIGNHRVLVSHFPYHPISTYEKNEKEEVKCDFSFENDRRYLHKRILDDGKTWLIHGHCHNAWKQKGRQINIGVDVWNYAPVHHEKILELINAGPNFIDVNESKKVEDY